MTISRWKIMAGFLGLSVGGLAVCSGQTSTPLIPPPAKKMDEPGIITLPPAPPAKALPEPVKLPETLPPSNPVKKESAIEIELPALSTPPTNLLPVKSETKLPESKETKPPAIELELPPVGNYEPEKKAQPIKIEIPTKTEIPKSSDELPINLNPVVETPKTAEPIKLLEAPKPITNNPPPAPTSFDPPAVKANPEAKPKPVELTPPAVGDLPRAPVKSEPVKQPVEPTKAVEIKQTMVEPTALPTKPSEPIKPKASTATDATKLKLLLRLDSGKPRFEIRNSTTSELLFKVYGDKVEIQSNVEGAKSSPLAGVTASGNVRFVGPDMEGTCDQLTLLSGTGEVLMKGNVQLKTKSGRTWSELSAEKMIYQIGLTGLRSSSKASKTPANNEESVIRPAVHRE